MKEIKVVLVTGSRDWTRQDIIFNALQEHLGDHVLGIVRHGGCPTGADKMADNWVALQPGIAVDLVPANWHGLGRRAGPIRNKQMVNLGADICLAFPLGESRGTRGCMRLAKEAGIEVLDYGMD